MKLIVEQLLRVLSIFILILLIAVAATGCDGFLEVETFSETLHPLRPYVPQPEEHIEISNYNEMLEQLIGLVMQHDEKGKLYATNYSGDVTADIGLACEEIRTHHPVGAYAVAAITGEAVRIVSVVEIDVSIEYKREKEQVDSIISISTLHYLRTELLSAMSDYREELVLRTSLFITEEQISEMITDVYYENPRKIVMLPVVAFETFPKDGAERIFELRFGNMEQASILRQYGESLAASYVRRNAGLAVGDTDAEILVSLAENLIASTSFDEGTAQAISVHGAQNFAATAYGALANGNAVGEGFAMAYKALCDELSVECKIVLGYLGDMVHAWNIVRLNGYNYHVDVAMCAVNGIASAFMKNDKNLPENYMWEKEKTGICRGTLTYEEIVGIIDTEDPNTLPGDEPIDGADDGEPGDDENGEPNAERNGESNGESNGEPGGEPNDETNDGPSVEPDDGSEAEGNGNESDESPDDTDGIGDEEQEEPAGPADATQGTDGRAEQPDQRDGGDTDTAETP